MTRLQGRALLILWLLCVKPVVVLCKREVGDATMHRHDRGPPRVPVSQAWQELKTSMENMYLAAAGFVGSNNDKNLKEMTATSDKSSQETVSLAQLDVHGKSPGGLLEPINACKEKCCQDMPCCHVGDDVQRCGSRGCEAEATCPAWKTLLDRAKNMSSIFEAVVEQLGKNLNIPPEDVHMGPLKKFERSNQLAELDKRGFCGITDLIRAKFVFHSPAVLMNALTALTRLTSAASVAAAVEKGPAPGVGYRVLQLKNNFFAPKNGFYRDANLLLEVLSATHGSMIGEVQVHMHQSSVLKSSGALDATYTFRRWFANDVKDIALNSYQKWMQNINAAEARNKKSEAWQDALQIFQSVGHEMQVLQDEFSLMSEKGKVREMFDQWFDVFEKYMIETVITKDRYFDLTGKGDLMKFYDDFSRKKKALERLLVPFDAEDFFSFSGTIFCSKLDEDLFKCHCGTSVSEMGWRWRISDWTTMAKIKHSLQDKINWQNKSIHSVDTLLRVASSDCFWKRLGSVTGYVLEIQNQNAHGDSELSEWSDKWTTALAQMNDPTGEDKENKKEEILKLMQDLWKILVRMQAEMILRPNWEKDFEEKHQAAVDALDRFRKEMWESVFRGFCVQASDTDTCDGLKVMNSTFFKAKIDDGCKWRKIVDESALTQKRSRVDVDIDLHAGV